MQAGVRWRSQILRSAQSAEPPAVDDNGRMESRAPASGRGELLWRPSTELVERARMTDYIRWLGSERGLEFEDYEELWRWSVDDLEGFWGSIWDFFGVRAEGGYDRVLGRREMPGAEWFGGTRLNYAEQVFAGKEDAAIAILHASELRELSELSWGELRSGCRRDRGGTARSGRRARGPGCRLPAQHPGGDHRLPRHRQHRRDLVELLSGFRSGQRHRPLCSDRARRR